MTIRKKPQGEDWRIFFETWNTSNHIDKIALTQRYGVTYDTAKHWVSEGDTTQQSITVEPNDDLTKEVVAEILGAQPYVNLEFAMFDLETTNLTADFSVVLCACIKPFGRDPVIFRADDYEEWFSNRASDKEICEAITKELCKYAVIVTHYGTGFDIPYLKAKLVKYGLPPLPTMFGVDTYAIAKHNFRVSRKRLAALAEYFELGKKEGVEGGLWMEAAMNGTREALDKIVAHNITDCIILEKLAAISFPYLKSMRKI